MKLSYRKFKNKTDNVRFCEMVTINSINMSYYNYKSGRNTFKEHDLIKGPLYMTKMDLKIGLKSLQILSNFYLIFCGTKVLHFCLDN